MTLTFAGFEFDPADPQAPPQEVWDRLSDHERERLRAVLVWEGPMPNAAPPEGDTHRDSVQRTREMLRRHFRRLRRKIYIGNDLPIFYPGERMFSPDVIAVTDVEDHDRDSWIVSAEGKGLDLAIEIHWRGDQAKDAEANVKRYAHLGIPEYFAFDLKRMALRGWRLPHSGARVYQRLVPQSGRFESSVLGVELGVEGDRLEFYVGEAALPDTEDVISKLSAALERVEARAVQEAQRAEQEAKRAEEERRQRAIAETKLAEVMAELERLKRGQ